MIFQKNRSLFTVAILLCCACWLTNSAAGSNSGPVYPNGNGGVGLIDVTRGLEFTPTTCDRIALNSAGGHQVAAAPFLALPIGILTPDEPDTKLTELLHQNSGQTTPLKDAIAADTSEIHAGTSNIFAFGPNIDPQSKDFNGGIMKSSVTCTPSGAKISIDITPEYHFDKPGGTTGRPAIALNVTQIQPGAILEIAWVSRPANEITNIKKINCKAPQTQIGGVNYDPCLPNPNPNNIRLIMKTDPAGANCRCVAQRYVEQVPGAQAARPEIFIVGKTPTMLELPINQYREADCECIREDPINFCTKAIFTFNTGAIGIRGSDYKINHDMSKKIDLSTYQKNSAFANDCKIIDTHHCTNDSDCAPQTVQMCSRKEAQTCMRKDVDMSSTATYSRQSSCSYVVGLTSYLSEQSSAPNCQCLKGSCETRL